jgi:hypothetical protein
MWGLYGRQLVQGKFDPAHSLFGLPFLLGTIVLLIIITYLLFGHWRINVGRGECEIFSGVGPLGRRRRIRLERASLVRMEASTLKVNNVPRQHIVITTGDEQLKFGATLPVRGPRVPRRGPAARGRVSVAGTNDGLPWARRPRHHFRTMKNIRLLLLASAMPLVVGACTPHVTRTGSELQVNSGIFGPRVNIGGLDDDDTPVSVNVQRSPGRDIVTVQEDE